MFYPLTRQVLPPTALPLTLEQAKAHLKLDGTAEDAYLLSLIGAVAGWWEAATGTALMQTEYVTIYAGFGVEYHGLRGPATELISLTYATDTNINTAALLTDYALSEGRAGVLLYTGSTTFPTLRSQYAEPVRVRYRAGYVTPAAVPELIKQALRLVLGHWYENRQQVLADVRAVAIELPLGADRIVNLFRAPTL